jgi:mannosyltransferase
MINSKRKEISILLLCLLIGFALRFYTFDRKSLWMDEIYTFNDSRDDLNGQIKFYKQNPTFLHPPLFFILTHLFYPFEKPERDLRIIPLIFGILSIPMIYFLSRLFSPDIALPCTLSLTFMTYHISLSQDGRSYSMLMFLGMAGIYFFLKHLHTHKKQYLFLVALIFSILFHTSYSSIPFIAFSQILWFYRPSEEYKKPSLSCFFILNGLILLFCLPWILFVVVNYKGRPLMDAFHIEGIGSFWSIFHTVFGDWLPHSPLMIVAVMLTILSLALSKSRKNELLLLAIIIFPIGSLFVFCKLFEVTHFITSRYFISFLPLFLILLFLMAQALEDKLLRAKSVFRFKMLFVVLFIASNLAILPLYYRSEKQNFRDLVTFLKTQLQEGDKIIDLERMGTLGMLHYFGANPEGRHFLLDFSKVTGKEIEYRKSFLYRKKTFTIYHSTKCCSQYVNDGGRLWIIASKWGAKKIKDEFPCALIGYFDASFSNIGRFPSDASIYLFLRDPQSPNEKGLSIPIE